MNAVAEPRLTLPELALMMRAAIRDRRYQQETRLGGAVAEYLAWARLKLAARSLEIYEGYLARLCILLADRDPAVDAVTADMLLEGLGEHQAGSFKIVRTSYSEFFEWAVLWDRCQKNPAKKLPKMPEPTEKVYEVFTALEQGRLIKATDTMPLPWVQRTRVLCLIDLGIRKEEARGLRICDFDMIAKVAVIRGKGGKERLVPISEELWRAVVTFRNRPLPKVRMTDKDGSYREDRAPVDDDHLFFAYGATKTGLITFTNPARPLSERGMHAWWAQYVVPAAGIKYRSMHMARHTVATDLADADADSFTIQDWLGHADPKTTKIYVHNSRSRLQKGRTKLDEYREGRG